MTPTTVVALIVEADAASDDRGIALEAARPETRADDRDGRAALAVRPRARSRARARG